jgi:hypothetical protein
MMNTTYITALMMDLNNDVTVPVGVMGLTNTSGLAIVTMDDYSDTIVVCMHNGTEYCYPEECEVEYKENPERANDLEDETDTLYPVFTYNGTEYFLDDFMICG